MPNLITMPRPLSATQHIESLAKNLDVIAQNLELYIQKHPSGL